MYCLDVFDFLIINTENVKNEFYFAIQQQLQNNEYDIPFFIRNNFVDLRKNAELMANRIGKRGGREAVCLEEIYKLFEFSESVTEESVQKIKKIEEDIYAENAVGIEDNIRYAENLIQKGERVLFIADTIYGNNVIKKILVKCSSQFRDAICICSSEAGKTQATGNLFWKINHITGVKRTDIVYCSMSHQRCDEAKRVGLNVLEFTPKMEANNAEIEEKNRDFTTAIVDKLVESIKSECGNDKRWVGISIGGPILLAYVEWILMCAENMQIRKLYFVARDGYILKKIADVLIAERKIPIETFYIHGSRRAWRIPTISRSNCDIAELLRWSHIESIKTYGEFAKIFEIGISELEHFLHFHGVTYTTPMSKTAMAYAIKQLKDNENFKRYLIEKNESKRELLKGYIKQYIDSDTKEIAFVELAGGGYTQECLATVLAELGIIKTINFYFKMDSIKNRNICHNYVFWFNDMHNSAIIETLCHSSEGQTMGYQRKDNMIVPILESAEGRALRKYGYEEYVEGVLIFVRKYMKYVDGLFQKNNTLYMVTKYMEMIGEHPTKELLRFISELPFGVTGRETRVREYAPILTEQQIEDYYKNGAKGLLDYKGMNVDYSIMRTEREWGRQLKPERQEQNSLNHVADEMRLEFPREYLEQNAVFVEADGVSEAAYATITLEDKSIRKIHLHQICSQNIDKDQQYVIACKDADRLRQLQVAVESLGVFKTRIFAIQMEPRFVIEN